jgi:hypothetical protein
VAHECLVREGEEVLNEPFSDFETAINVLKHGRGRSYDALLATSRGLPFRVKRPNEAYFFEGDVSEITTLIKVDDGFVMGCAEIIRDVSSVIRRTRPESSL